MLPGAELGGVPTLRRLSRLCRNRGRLWPWDIGPRHINGRRVFRHLCASRCLEWRGRTGQNRALRHPGFPVHRVLSGRACRYRRPAAVRLSLCVRNWLWRTASRGWNDPNVSWGLNRNIFSGDRRCRVQAASRLLSLWLVCRGLSRLPDETCPIRGRLRNIERHNPLTARLFLRIGALFRHSRLRTRNHTRGVRQRLGSNTLPRHRGCDGLTT